MSSTIIYDTSTRAILAIDPPLHDGNPLLPLGVAAAVATVSDAEAAKFTTANARFSLAADGLTITVAVQAPQAPDPTIAADQQAYAAIAAATTLDQVKTAILAWMAARPGIEAT